MDAIVPDGRENIVRSFGLVNMKPPGAFGKDLLQACPDILIDGGCAISNHDIHGRAKQPVHRRDVLNHRLSARSRMMFYPSAEGRDFLMANIQARTRRVLARDAT